MYISYMEECLPLNTKVMYNNDEGNILHLTKYKTLLKQIIIGVNKRVNRNVFDRKKMKQNIRKQKNSYRAEKNLLNKITIYNGTKQVTIIKKCGHRYIIYNGLSIQMIIRSMSAATYPTEWIIEYKTGPGKYIYLMSAHYRWSGVGEEYIACYEIMKKINGRTSEKNTIIKDKDNNNKIEFMELNNELFKLGFDESISELDAFIFGAILLFA